MQNSASISRSRIQNNNNSKTQIVHNSENPQIEIKNKKSDD